MPLAPPDPIRVFVSSPGDVWPERAASLRAIELLNRRYAGLLKLEGVFWEEHFFPSTEDFQSWINHRIPPWDCALVVCILWSRIGSPLSDAWPRRGDGTAYESGTVAEFEMTLPHAQHGPLPDLYMFMKTAALPGGTSSDELRRAAEAKAVVEGFMRRWFHQASPVPSPGATAEVHPFTAGFNPFPSTEAFEDLFVRFLEWWLREKGWIDRPRTWDLQRQGLPYVGLAAFTASHSAVFFGRDADRRQARRLLIEAGAAGLPYLLLSGDSGVGKSSLARAGVVADLCIDTPQEAWVPVVLVAGSDPLAHLAEALLAEDCPLRPHLLSSAFPDAARLKQALADPAVAVSVITHVLKALADTQKAARNWDTAPKARLLLVLDQAEALADAGAAMQQSIVATVAALVATRRVWMVATLRLDRMAALFSPDLIIIGGGVSREHEKFFPYFTPETRIVPDLLVNNAGIVGAALAAQARRAPE